MAATMRQAPTNCSLAELFGDNLRAFREAEALSVDDLATLLGVERSVVEGIERGEEDLSFERVEVIGATLGIEPLSLLR